VDSWPAWSPDGSQIAFVRDGDVFLVSPLGGAERKVAKSAGRVAWMPDGQALLTLEKTSLHARSVFRVSVLSEEKRRITFPNDLSPGDVDMAASPDGRTIAVCRTTTTEGCDLFLVPVAGGESRRLTNYQRGIQGFAWTSDGKQIVFASNRQGWFQLWRVAAHPVSGSGAYPTAVLVEAAGDDARNPSIRGTRLVYQRHTRDFDIKRAEIAGVPGTAAHELKSSTPLISSTRLDVTPAWSPDGKRIAFVSDRSGARELWICESDGSSPLRLTSFSGPAVIFPRWSPNGERLVFSALTGADGNFEGYTMDAKGGRPERLSVRGHPSIAHPIFSVDGRWLYFIPGPEERAVEIWRAPASGGDAIQITKNGAFRPEISPDGKLLYYGKHDTHGLWSLPIEGGDERRVLGSITEMNWTVAKEGIYYIDFGIEANAPKALMFWSSQTGKVNRVGSVEATVSGDYSGISISSDGRWLLYSYIANLTSDLMMVDHFH
jgi:Tol biopolymer transport system component